MFLTQLLNEFRSEDLQLSNRLSTWAVPDNFAETLPIRSCAQPDQTLQLLSTPCRPFSNFMAVIHRPHHSFCDGKRSCFGRNL